MPQTPDNNQQIPPEELDDDDEINLIDLLLVLLKRKRFIFKIVSSVFILSIIVSLLLPKSYKATAEILPPQKSESPMSYLLSQTGGTLGSLAAGIFGGGGSSSDLYVGILESHTVADNLIKKYDLKKRYNIKYMSSVYKKLSDVSSFDVDSKSQIISISVEDRDPQMAADLANRYVEALDAVNRKVSVNEGRRKRIFLEKRLKKVNKDLIKAETALKVFQEKHRLVSIDEQAKAAIEGAAQIKAEIIESQTELKVLKDFGTEKQNQAIMLQAKIAELQNQLDRIESGNKGKDDNSFFIPFSKLPELGMQFANLTREAKVQEKVFELLTNQYELAKIEEAKDVNTIQVLDKAVPPDKSDKPKRSIIVIFFTLIAFFIAVFLAFFFEFIEKVKIENEERYNALVKCFKKIDFKKYKEYIETLIKFRKRK